MKATTVAACICVLLSVLGPVASAKDSKHKNVAILGNDFVEKTSDGKLYFIKARPRAITPRESDLAKDV